MNKGNYPFLHYPELYVLFGGYKDFFEQFKSYCDPETYLPMVHASFTEQYKLYKAESKTDVVAGTNVKSKSFPKISSFRKSSIKKLEL
jgi:hypothetical protein